MSVKRLAVVSVLMCLGVGVSLAQTDLAAVDPAGQHVTYWHGYAGDQVELLNEMVDEFNATNEYGIVVEAIDQPELREQMSVAIISGDLPSLVGGFPNDAKSWFVDGVVQDFTPYINDATWGLSEADQADFNPAILSELRSDEAPFDGQLILFPNHFTANVMSVNLDMLAEVGFDGSPETLDEFRDIACATTELEGPDGQPIGGFALRTEPSDFESFVVNLGGEIFDVETGQYSFTNNAVIEILTLFKELYDAGCAYIPDSPFGNTDDLAFGLTPMALGSTAGIPFIQGNIEVSGSGVDNWINTIPPWTDNNQSLQIFVPGVVLIESTPEQELASWLFVKYLTSTENQLRWAQRTAFFPTRLSAAQGLSEEFLAENPHFASVNEMIVSGDVNLYINPQPSSYGAVRNLMATAIGDVTVNGRDVMEVATELEEEANRIHQESLELQS